MKFEPSENLSNEQVDSGLKLVVKDGLAAEAMATLTGGAFLVSLALHFGASNFQIGLLAALPTLVSIAQFLGIYLVQKHENRKPITVYASIIARLPLLLISALPFLFPPNISLYFLIGFLFIHYFFGSLSGCSWTSWLKDLVPEERLGTYFSNRSRLITILGVSLSFITATTIDYVKSNYPQYEINAYSIMFLIGGICGILGIIFIAKTPEPKIKTIKNKNLFHLFKNPLKNVNFRNLIIFNSFWAFAINLAAPFYSVYLLKMLNLPLSYVVGFNILSQVANIFSIRIWGRYSDKYSNKSILKICAPIYLFCILGWTFTTLPGPHVMTIPLLVIIFIFNGIALSGINLSISNIGIKLAPKEGDAIVYLTTRGIITSCAAGIAPIIGGFFADFFATQHLSWNFEWSGPNGTTVLHFLDLHQWDFFFVVAFLLGLFSLYRLTFVEEKGEVRKRVIMKDIAAELTTQLRNNTAMSGIRSFIFVPLSFYTLIKRKTRIARYKKMKLKMAKQ
ncbi:MAG TPA: MFS transporter [Cytophagaceae bacterium]